MWIDILYIFTIIFGTNFYNFNEIINDLKYQNFILNFIGRIGLNYQVKWDTLTKYYPNLLIKNNKNENILNTKELSARLFFAFSKRLSKVQFMKDINLYIKSILEVIHALLVLN